ILLDLEAHPPDAAIDRVSVLLEPIPGRRVQFSLFRRPLPAPDQIATLTARLQALMGEDRCGTPSLRDTHRPGAFDMTSFTPANARDAAGGELWRAGSTFARETSMSERRRTRGDAGQPHAVLRRFRRPIDVKVTLQESGPVRLATGGTSLISGPINERA